MSFVDLLTIKSISQLTWSLEKQWVTSKLYASMTDDEPDPCTFRCTGTVVKFHFAGNNTVGGFHVTGPLVTMIVVFAGWSPL